MLPYAVRLPAVRGLTLALALAFTLGACATSGAGPSAPAAESADAASESPAATQGLSLELVDGKLPVLPDGFPNGPITLWNANDLGHTDDVLNTVVAEIAQKYSPVPITKATRPSAPELHYALVEYLRTQPLGDNGAYHPMMMSHFGLAIRPYTQETLCDRSYQEEFIPVNSMLQAPYLFVVPEDSEFETLEDVIEYIRANPGELNVASTSPGSGIHSGLAVLFDEAGIDIEADVNLVPTSGSGETKTVLLGGGAAFGSLVYGPGVLDGIRAVGTTGTQQFSVLPDVPPASDFGYVVPAGASRGYAVTGDTPDDHVAWVAELFRLVSEDPEWAESNPEADITLSDREATVTAVEEYLDSVVPSLEAAGLLSCPV